MKLAPNVKQQSRGIKHKGTEVIIFAGSDAWAVSYTHLTLPTT